MSPDRPEKQLEHLFSRISNTVEVMPDHLWLIRRLSLLLVLRYLDFIESELEAIAEFNDETYTPLLSHEFRWSHWRKRPKDAQIEYLREKLVSALTTAPSTPLGLLLRRLSPAASSQVWNYPSALLSLMEWVDAQPFDRPGDRAKLGEAIERLLVEAAGRSSAEIGPHVTPPAVVALMVELANPRIGERIYDPCFGTGGLLAACARRIQAQREDLSPRSYQETTRGGVFGVERNLDAWVIGLARTLLAGVAEPGLELGDTLERPLPRDPAAEGFDVILANPPWGGRVAPELAAHFPFATLSVEALFLQHIMAFLRPGGRAVVVVPNSVLFQGGPAMGLREQLLRQFSLEGVIALPAGAFVPYTGIPSNILVFRRLPPTRQIRFFFVGDFPTGSHTSTKLTGEERETLARALANRFRTGEPGDDLWIQPVEVLERQDWTLLVRRSPDDALEPSIRSLKAVAPDIPFLPLEEIARVFAGVSYDRSNTRDHKEDVEESVGLVRVGDIANGTVRTPSLYFRNEKASPGPGDDRLQVGDILMTLSGSPGKIAVLSLESRAIGALATKSLAVIRPLPTVDPAYLAGVLLSPEYQQLLKGLSHGTTLQHVSIRALRQISVPVPTISRQTKVVRNAGKRQSIISALLVDAGASAPDPLVQWLEASEALEALRQDEPGDGADISFTVEKLLREVQALRTGQDVSSLDALVVWHEKLRRALAPLAGLGDISSGTGRVALLGMARADLQGAMEPLIRAEEPQIELARQTTRALAGRFGRESTRIVEDARLDVRLEPEQVVAGRTSEVRLIIANKGACGVRALTITLETDERPRVLGWLSEEKEATVVLPVTPVPGHSRFPIEVHWRCLRLDGIPQEGKFSLAVAVRSTRDAVLAGDLGSSPYNNGRPISDPKELYGRQGTLAEICRQFPSDGRGNVVLIEGNRRTGKTSLLRCLKREEMLPGWIPAECDFQGVGSRSSELGVTTRDIFEFMAKRLAEESFERGFQVWPLDTEPPASPREFRRGLPSAVRKLFDGLVPFEAFEAYLRRVLEAVRPKRLLLMLDEFDKLQEGIDAGRVGKEVPENLRYLLNHYPDLSAILAGSLRLTRLRQEYWSVLFGLGYRVGISAIPHEAALSLVSEPVKGKLEVLDEAREFIVEQCANQPFLIQTLCNKLFELAAEHRRRVINLQDAELATRALVEDNEHLRTLWDSCLLWRRKLILKLCQTLATGIDPITLHLLVHMLQELSLPLPQDELIGEDIDLLLEQELIERHRGPGADTYQLAVPLMFSWLARHVDLEDVRQRAITEATEE